MSHRVDSPTQSLAVGKVVTGILLLGMMGCGLYSRDEGIPSYLLVENFEWRETNGAAGTLSRNIKDVWVYIDGDLQGVYPLPARIPLLKEGSQALQLSAGILLNGISATRAIYPFYQRWDTLIHLQRGRTDTLRPWTTYRNTTRTVWTEDFEGLGFGLRARSGSDTVLLRESQADSVYEGTSCLKMVVDHRAQVLVAESIDQVGLQPGSPCFLELNYRNNVPLQVGLQSQLGSDLSDPLWIIELAPSALWSKQYLNFTPYLGMVSGARYRLLLRPVWNQGNSGVGVVRVDNLKWLQ